MLAQRDKATRIRVECWPRKRMMSRSSSEQSSNLNICELARQGIADSSVCTPRKPSMLRLDADGKLPAISWRARVSPTWFVLWEKDSLCLVEIRFENFKVYDYYCLNTCCIQISNMILHERPIAHFFHQSRAPVSILSWSLLHSKIPPLSTNSCSSNPSSFNASSTPTVRRERPGFLLPP